MVINCHGRILCSVEFLVGRISLLEPLFLDTSMHWLLHQLVHLKFCSPRAYLAGRLTYHLGVPVPLSPALCLLVLVVKHLMRTSGEWPGASFGASFWGSGCYKSMLEVGSVSHLIEQSFSDCFRAKASTTLQKRANSLWKLPRTFASNGMMTPLRFSEEHLYMALRSLYT